MTILATAEVLRPYLHQSALDDLGRARSLGVMTSVGATSDPALEAPETIARVFTRIVEGERAFRRAVGPAHPHLARVAGLVRQLPVAYIANVGRHVSRRVRSHAERVRAEVLYDQPDVRAWAWHVQSGRALALGSIIDALDLDAPGSPGRYRAISGRLEPGVATHVFGPGSGWLSGLTLEDAMVESFRSFRGDSRSRALRRAATELVELADFTSAGVELGFKEIVGYCFDSLGIRSRKAEVRARIASHVESLEGSGELLMLSIGCGTALPMLEVLADTIATGRDARLILVDQDPVALAAADQLAAQLGLAHAIEIHCERLITGRGRSTRVLDLLPLLDGRLVDVCEDSGLREYFPGFLYRDLAAKAWACVRPGGLMTTGNMNVHRPQPEFLHGLMGWPIRVQMRSAVEVVKEHLAVGVPPEAMHVRLTQDHVYVICSAVKPPEGPS